MAGPRRGEEMIDERSLLALREERSPPGRRAGLNGLDAAIAIRIGPSLDECAAPPDLLGADGDDHRRDWIVERLHTRCDAFAIDVATLAGTGDFQQWDGPWSPAPLGRCLSSGSAVG